MLRSSRTSASARPPPSRGPTGGRRFPGVAASLLGGGLGRAAVILLVALLGVPRPAPAAEGATFDYWLTGNGADARPPQTRPGLFLSGGGGDVAAAWKWFVACAGGGDIVILRASGGNGYQSYVFDEIGGTDSVETIKFNDPAAATDPRVLDLIRRAEGIFLAGGDQARYVRLWKDTPIAAALNEHLRRGRPLGGTSAGLAVLGQYYFSALADTITSPAALADPFDRRLTVGRDFLQAPELVGILTDSHFMARQRLGRLITFLARVQHDERPSRLAGLGLDEGTALCVEPGGSSRVFSAKQGLAWLVLPPPDPPALVPGQPLAVSGVRVLGLGPDSHLDLAQFKVDRPAVRRTVQVTAGRVEDHANPSP